MGHSLHLLPKILYLKMLGTEQGSSYMQSRCSAPKPWLGQLINVQSNGCRCTLAQWKDRAAWEGVLGDSAGKSWKYKEAQWLPLISSE